MYREGGKHRFSTVRSADRIYVLNDGYVIESGTHEEPLAAGATYAELFTLQASRTSSASPVRAPRVSQPLCVHERQAGSVCGQLTGSVVTTELKVSTA